AELIDDVAAALAGLHRMDTRTGLVPSIDGPLQRRCGRPMSASVSRIRRSSWRFARWRADRRRPRALVHGDFRMGNLMVGGAGLTGVPRA
ncbi:MAG TPA: phosphotransferase, partial [Solirubrobacteraceae bacterium]|nr:phosphotransferase [Solirubrobacteraceae bacterium]